MRDGQGNRGVEGRVGRLGGKWEGVTSSGEDVNGDRVKGNRREGKSRNYYF